jgi:hypothetical protein
MTSSLYLLVEVARSVFPEADLHINGGGTADAQGVHFRCKRQDASVTRSVAGSGVLALGAGASRLGSGKPRLVYSQARL